MSVSTENFIKAVYKQKMIDGLGTRTGTLAKLLGITNAATTDMARKLADNGLVVYEKYKPLTLTDKGLKLALNIIRKHRLWESFLYKTLNLTLHEIHQEAEQLEHQTSDFLAGKIEKYLGYPAKDPHGDPIPALNGKIKHDSSQFLLSKAEENNMYKITRLSGSGKDFFDFCTSNQIAVGSKIWVEKQYSSNRMTEVKINKNKILLNEDFTSIIYVKQTKNIYK
ncbi:MAG: metal-dependent transcriptional regulator [Bacteroidales bacterium]|nr:metal-dependent transcriptional regulator [Bacteroidales bacterium]